MKKNLLFAQIVLCIAIAFGGCTRCDERAEAKLYFYSFDSTKQTYVVINKYDYGTSSYASFTKLVATDTFHAGPVIKDLDYNHDWEVLFSNSNDTFRITELKYIKKYRQWPGGGTVDEKCHDMISYRLNGVRKQDWRIDLYK